jgi:LysR family transcriptional regulator, mexEF-oprN operon transcriptional activator
MTDLRLFDLNLLVAFEALIAERNVTRAAQRVGLGQPAMSYALSRLRELFADELFVRAPGSMQPTTRALELAPSIARVLADIRTEVLADRAFDPRKTAMTFRIGAADHREVVILPKLLADLRAAAPGARLVVRQVDEHNLPTMLESGAIDVAIGHFPAAAVSSKADFLFHEDFVCVFDSGACKASVPITLEQYLALPHIVMSLTGELKGNVDPALARTGAQRFVVMATAHFLAVPYMLRGFRAIAAMPRQLAEHCRDVTGLAVSPLPVKTRGYDVSLYWHGRTETDPAHSWFRELIRQSLQPEARPVQAATGQRSRR